MRRVRWLGLLVATVASLLGVGSNASLAHAEEIRAHATLGGAHAVGEPQQREFGFGLTGSASLEIPAGKKIGIEVKGTGLVLVKGDPPKDPTLAAQSTGTAALGTLGLRIRPFTAVAGPWASIGAGIVQTGDRTRFGIDSQLGWDFRVGKGRLDMGPYVGFIDVVQPEDSLRPNDAYIVSLGLHVGLGVRAEVPVVPSDRDHDGIVDLEDACPDVPGIRTSDPKTNGCPRGDRDKDTVFDDEDACPDEAGIRTSDPKTNGCPRGDRDKDTVYDDEDACPDVAGIRTTDPKTNGCPSDRDQDGIPDALDACPDLAGIKTDDPKTNGCPEATDQIRVEKDKILFDEVILFDLDSPRVRHASWPIIGKLADFMIKNPDILEVSIEGHADATGTVEHNLTLSRQRAESVRTLLIQGGVEPKRIKAEAFGRSRLKVQTTHAEAANRRVEFWITRTRGVAP